MDVSKRYAGGQVRLSHKTRQSDAVIPSRSIQDAMSKRWEIEPIPLYLIRDPDGNTLRLYKDLNRASNWTRGTSRAIINNKPAAENWERNHETGNAMLDLIGGGLIFGFVGWCLLEVGLLIAKLLF